MRGQNAMDTLNVRTARWVTKVPWHGWSAASCPRANSFVRGVSSCRFCQDREGTIVSIDQLKFLPDVFFQILRARSIQPKFAVQNQICGQPVVLFPRNFEIPGIFCSFVSGLFCLRSTPVSCLISSASTSQVYTATQTTHSCIWHSVLMCKGRTRPR